MSVVSEISASSAVKKQEKKIVENLTKRTHFSSAEIERLLNLYRKTMVRTCLHCPGTNKFMSEIPNHEKSLKISTIFLEIHHDPDF